MKPVAEAYTSGPREDPEIIIGAITALFDILYPGHGKQVISRTQEGHLSFLAGSSRSPAVMSQMVMAKHDRDLTEARPTLFRITVEAVQEIE